MEKSRQTWSDAIPVLILSPSPLSPALLDRLQAVSPRLQIKQRPPQTALSDEDWADVEVLYTPAPLPTLEQAPCLRWVQYHYAGVEHFVSAPPPLFKRVTLVNASGVHAPAVAEYVIMMMLAFTRQLPLLHRYQTFGTWAPHRTNRFAARELRGATIGIVGYGSIGRQVARVASGFGMRILATKRNPEQPADFGWRVPGTGDPTGELVQQFYPPRDITAMAAASDFLVLTAPLTPETRGWIELKVFNAMKKEAVLINVARGSLVDETALIQALQYGDIGGAVLDVFAQEPLPSTSPLWQLGNAILSPHISGLSLNSEVYTMALFAENLRRYLIGEMLFNVVDLKKGY